MPIAASVNGVGTLLADFVPSSGDIILATAVDQGSSLAIDFTHERVDQYAPTDRLARVYSVSDPNGEWLSLSEVLSDEDSAPSPTSGVFRGSVSISLVASAAAPGDGTVLVTHGDRLTVTYYEPGGETVIDTDIAALDLPSPTATPSPQPTASPTLTPTAPSTPSPPPTVTPLTSTPVATPSPQPATSTLTPTPTGTPPAAATATPTEPPVATPTTVPPTSTPAATSTGTPSQTPSPTPRLVPAPVASPAATGTPVPDQAVANAVDAGPPAALAAAPAGAPSQECEFSLSAEPVIKGNIGDGGEKIYHVPGGPYYSRTAIDESKGERWFCTVAEAAEAGWRPPATAAAAVDPTETATAQPPSVVPTATAGGSFAPAPQITASPRPVPRLIPTPTPTFSPTPAGARPPFQTATPQGLDVTPKSTATPAGTTIVAAAPASSAPQPSPTVGPSVVLKAEAAQTATEMVRPGATAVPASADDSARAGQGSSFPPAGWVGIVAVGLLGLFLVHRGLRSL